MSDKSQDSPSPDSDLNGSDTVADNNTDETAESKDKSDDVKNKSDTTEDAASTSVIFDEDSIEPGNDDYMKSVVYTSDNVAIFTDPKTNCKYKYCTIAKNWLPCNEGDDDDDESVSGEKCDKSSKDATKSSNVYENEHYKWCSETKQWIQKTSLVAGKAQVTETEYYKWDATKNEWIPKTVELMAGPSDENADRNSRSANTYDIDEDGKRIYTDKDGAVYFWDTDKNAWFPKIDDDFMARYQMNYGFNEAATTSTTINNEKSEISVRSSQGSTKNMSDESPVDLDKSSSARTDDATEETLKRKSTQNPPQWFNIDPEHNTKVYVSNLPLDITIDEFAELMGKCGMIMRDQKTQNYKLKLYTEPNGQIKGDGLCDYIKVESVSLALKILDDYNFRGHKIRVQRAEFEMRGEYNPLLKPKRKKKDKEKLQKIKEKLFDWRPEKMRGERSRHEKVVIIKNLFDPVLFEKNIQLLLDYSKDLREECEKYGYVSKVIVYDRHPEGVAQVNMSSPEEADLVIKMMNGRYFAKRQLTVEHWDGKTKYRVVESEKEAENRISKWENFLESDEEPKLKQTNETESSEITNK